MIKNQYHFIFNLTIKYVKLTFKNIFEFYPNYLRVSNYNWQMIQTRNRLKEKKDAEYGERWKEIREQYSKIQFHYLWTNRIGEFGSRIAEIEKEFGRIDFANKDCDSNSAEVFHVFAPSHPIANDWAVNYFAKYYETITEKNIEFWEWVLRKYKNKIDFSEWDKYRGRKSVIFNDDRNRYIKFTPEEEEYCLKRMERMGLKDNKYACIIIRDKAYLEKHTGVDDSRNNMRSGDSNQFIASIDFLEQKNLTAVRMGYIVSKAIKHKNCIDYATYYREEILDFFLMKNAKMWVGSAAGISCWTGMFACPRVMIDVEALTGGWGAISCTPDDIFLPLKWKLLQENRYLTFGEIFLHETKGLTSTKYQKEKGIIWEHNTEEEIKNATEELYSIVSGERVYSKEEVAIMSLYDKIAEEFSIQHPCDNPHGGRAPIKMSATFLMNNKELFGERILELELQ